MKFSSKCIFFTFSIVQMLSLPFSFSEARQVVLITGATRGVGLATAEYLACKGFCVYASGRTRPSFVDPSIHYVSLDVTDPHSIHAAIDSIIEKEGKIDILINNAGYGLVGPIETCSIEEFKQQMEVNFFGVIRVCQEILPHMRSQKNGKILTLSSTNAICPAPYGSAYSSSKAALESLLEVLSVEVSPWNIYVSIIEPGLLQTKFSLMMGTKKPQQNPYQSIVHRIQSSLDERADHPEKLFPSQTAAEIAQFLHQVIESPCPLLRYQTSQEAKQLVSIKLTDITGEIYRQDMKDDVKSFLEEDFKY
jgi:NAD(P)-dependent dehydrogenase (short-subunit alcohol dehydrogenase family)